MYVLQNLSGYAHCVFLITPLLAKKFSFFIPCAFQLKFLSLKLRAANHVVILNVLVRPVVQRFEGCFQGR